MGRQSSPSSCQPPGGARQESPWGASTPACGQHVDEGVPEKIAARLDGDSDDEARLAVGLAGALAEPDGDRGLRGRLAFVRQGTVEFEGGTDQPGKGAHEVTIGHRGADCVGMTVPPMRGRRGWPQARSPRCWQENGQKKFMAAVGVEEAGEAGPAIAAVEEGGDRRGGRGGKAGDVVGAIVENRPERRGVRLAAARVGECAAPCRWQ